MFWVDILECDAIQTSPYQETSVVLNLSRNVQ